VPAKRGLFLSAHNLRASIIAALMPLWPVVLSAQEPPPAPAAQAEQSEEAKKALEELERVRQNIKRENERLASLQSRQKEIKLELARADKELSLVGAEKDRLEKLVADLQQQVDHLNTAIGQNKEKVTSLNSRLSGRIAAIYKTKRRSAGLDYLFRATSANDFLKRSYYLSLMTGYDRQQLGLLRDEYIRLSDSERKLVQTKAEKADKLRLVEELEKKLAGKKIEKAELLREATEKQRLSERTITKLEKEAEKLEEIVAGLTGKEEYPAVQTAKMAPGQVNVVSAVSQTARALVKVSPFEGTGLARLKGTLEFPVSGRIVQHFGKQQHEEFADILFIKGLEVAGENQAKVRAIAPGKIMFDSVLPGYGNVIIIDHGARYYSLYGRLGKSLVHVGDDVESGAVIAELDKPDQKGRNFYFELRVQGKATDPAKFFKKLPPPTAQ